MREQSTREKNDIFERLALHLPIKKKKKKATCHPLSNGCNLHVRDNIGIKNTKKKKKENRESHIKKWERDNQYISIEGIN